MVAYQTAAEGGAVGGELTAVEDAAAQGEYTALGGHDAAVGAVAVDAAVDDDAAAAVADPNGAVLAANDAAGVFVGGIDVAVYMKAVDVGTVLHVAERRGVLLAEGTLGGAEGEGQRVALSVEGAHEVVVAAARHAGDGDVGAEFHRPVDEAVVGAVVL